MPFPRSWFLVPGLRLRYHDINLAPFGGCFFDPPRGAKIPERNTSVRIGFSSVTCLIPWVSIFVLMFMFENVTLDAD